MACARRRYGPGDVIAMVTLLSNGRLLFAMLSSGGFETQSSLPVNLTLDVVSATSAVLRWNVISTSTTSTTGLAESSRSRLIVRQLDPATTTAKSAGDDDFDGGGTSEPESRSSALPMEDPDVRVTVLEASSTGIHGRYRLDRLNCATSYSAQMIAEYYHEYHSEQRVVSNLSNVVYFDTLVGADTTRLSQFRMHPAELAVVALILGAWAGAVAAFLHKWRRLRIVPPRELRYKHAPPKNLEAVQVVTKPDESVIYKSYTRQLSTTMEARRSRLERMHTLPNIKLNSPTSSRSRARLDSTTEEGGDSGGTEENAASRRAAKLAKRKTESKFFGDLTKLSRRSSLFAAVPTTSSSGLTGVRQLVAQSMGGQGRAVARRQSELGLQAGLLELGAVDGGPLSPGGKDLDAITLIPAGSVAEIHELRLHSETGIEPVTSPTENGSLEKSCAVNESETRPREANGCPCVDPGSPFLELIVLDIPEDDESEPCLKAD